ncbi:hypothetical protein N9937_02200 [bacterium]|nr:hypothetical protein [bacterium]
MTTSYLKPRSVELPAQGAFQFRPSVFLLEDSSMAGLQAQLNAEVVTQQSDPANYWVIEDIQYVVSKDSPGMLYSVMIWATQVEKI